MKQRIRLTESDLRNIVREAINELDWKTYMNAARKAQKKADAAYKRYVDPSKRDDWDKNRNEYKKEDNRARDFSTSASKGLSKQFGRNLSLRPIGDDVYVKDNDGWWSDGSNATGPVFFGYHYKSPHDIDWDRDMEKIDWNGKFEEYGDIPIGREKYDFETDDEYKEFLQNNEIGHTIDNYLHGRTNYIKGEGWKNRRENNINETVSRIIRNYIR